MQVRIPYRPNAAAIPWHQSQARNRLICGGVGSGKTTAGAAEHFQLVGRAGPDLLHIVGAPSNKILKLATFPAVTAMIHAIEQTAGWSPAKRIYDTDQNRQIVWWNGARTVFLTLKNPEAIMGYNVATAWMDEAAAVEDSLTAFNMLTQRCRDPRAKLYALLLTTSPRGPVGVIEHFTSQIATGNPAYHMSTVRTADNAANLPAGYIEAMKAGMSERQVRQDIDGEILAWEGAVYSDEFHPVHSLASSWAWKRRRDVEIIVSIDWGPNHPHALFIEHGSDGVDVVFDEVCDDHMDHRALCGAIRKRMADKWQLTPRDLAAIHGDPNPPDAWNEVSRAFHGVARERRYGQLHQNIGAGINVVRGRLHAHDGKRLLLFAPRLQQTRSPRRILQCMLLYRWTEQATRDGMVFLDKPLKGTFDHGADALRYYLNNTYRWRRASSAYDVA